MLLLPQQYVVLLVPNEKEEPQIQKHTKLGIAQGHTSMTANPPKTLKIWSSKRNAQHIPDIVPARIWSLVGLGY